MTAWTDPADDRGDFDGFEDPIANIDLPHIQEPDDEDPVPPTERLLDEPESVEVDD